MILLTYLPVKLLIFSLVLSFVLVALGKGFKSEWVQVIAGLVLVYFLFQLIYTTWWFLWVYMNNLQIMGGH